jgi:hypothetical protein
MLDFPEVPETNIAGVFNYCFRWCERCPFTNYCTNFQMLEEMGQEIDTDEKTVPRVIREISTHLNEVIEELEQHYENAGYDWEEIKCAVDAAQPTSSELTLKELSKVSRRFTIQLIKWSEQVADQPQPSSWEEPFQVLLWYGTLLAAKVNRAVNGLEEAEPNEAPENSSSNIQSDGNGSAKIALLAIARSLGALAVMLRNPLGHEEELLTFALDLLRLQQGLRFQYPYADAFECAGFDDPDYYEEMAEFYNGHLPIDPFRDGPWQVQGARASDGW